MSRQKKYNIYTDASFDNKNSVATYSIIVMLENKILKSYSKKSRIEIKNSTEIEVFAVYQAMNLILSCYISKTEHQVFCINTDCMQVPIFFEDKNNKMKIFKYNENIKKDMLKTYNMIFTKLSRKNCSFSLKWIKRDLNKIAHQQSYNMLKRVRKVNKLNTSKEDVLIDKKIFCKILSNFDKKQISVFLYLLNMVEQDGLIVMTQKILAENLNVSILVVNETIKELRQFGILDKVKNGKYLLLI